MAKMTNIEFVNILKDIESQFKTSYMLGCFGQPATEENINAAVNRKGLNNKRFLQGANEIKNNGFMFDCVCLAKAILWGWNGDLKSKYGGSKYNSNNVPDISANQLIKACIDVSTDFNNIELGEVVWMEGHVGFYIGNGQVIECTPRWSVSPGVKKTYLENLGFQGSMSRFWTKHGKMPYLQYLNEDEKIKNENVEIATNYKDAIDFFVENGYLKGNGQANYGLDENMMRILTIFFRVLKDKGMA